MTLSLVLAFFWAIAANISAMIPTSDDDDWSRCYVLVGVGIPLLGYLTLQNGPWIGLLALAAGMTVLRWPLRQAARAPRKQAASEA